MDNSVVAAGRQLLGLDTEPEPVLLDRDDPVIAELRTEIAELREHIAYLHSALTAPRVRTPERDEAGRIVRVVDTVAL